jgi:2-succinyl-5-enolpyruvyl-6-hydroxy-3-cyclohexene-1-carboxylate synthase
VALLGDLAFFHDIGGLLAAVRAGALLTLVVVNNDGGSIFEQLPIASEIGREAFERLFAAPQHHDVSGLATAAGATSRLCSSAEISSALGETPPGGVHVLEVRQRRRDEVRHREQLWARLSDALAKAVEVPS